MRTRTIIGTAIVTIACVTNTAPASADSVRGLVEHYQKGARRGQLAIEVSPSVKSASYYAGHRSERDMVVTLCLVSRVADGSRLACENALESVVREVQGTMAIGGSCGGTFAC